MSDVEWIPEKYQVRRSFDRAAAQYDAAAVLQREVSDRMAERLEYIKHQPTHILDAGSGTGYGVTALRRRFDAARVIELDLALSMLRCSREKQQAQGHWLMRWRRSLPWQTCADIEALPLKTASMGVIWSNLAIQWLATPDAAFAEMYRVLEGGGLLMFSTLGPDTLQELRSAFANIDGYSHVNRFVDMHDLGDALVRAGFSEPVMDMEKIVMTYTDVKSLMRDLKGIGAHNSLHGRGRGLMGRRTWQTVEARYEQWRQDGRLPATYEVIYGHAWKPREEKKSSSHLPDGRQVIQFYPRVKS